MLRSNALILAAMALGIAILCALGAWQVQRLYWKEGLIAMVRERMNSEPEPLRIVDMLWQARKDVDYIPVTATGSFHHDAEMYYYTTYKGLVGWEVLTPFELEGGNILIVSRGFVPDDRRDPVTRADGQISGTIDITGIARNPLEEKPNRFMPENEPEKGVFYWKDFALLSALAIAGGEGKAESGTQVVPFIVDQTAPANPGGLPVVGTTRVSFPNNHLQYAVTWFGLALALLGVGSYFLYARRKSCLQPSDS